MSRSVLLLLPMLLAGCFEDAPAPPAPKPVVETALLTVAPDVAERRYTGTIEARTEADQAFRIGGKIVERLVDAGDRVEAGQVLARLDPGDFELEVASAEAELGAATAAVGQAEADERRGRSLEGRGVSTAEVERLGLVRTEAEGRLDRARQELALAQNRRGYATLAASDAGVVTETPAEPGQVVALGDAVVRIARLDALEIAVAIPEGRLADLATDDAAVTLWADDAALYPATLRLVSPEADPVSRTYAARFTLPPDAAAARLGMTATLVLRHGSGRPVVRLPLSAVVGEGDGASVFVVDPASNRLAAKPVEIVRYGATDAVLAADAPGGLAAGDRAVTLGGSRLVADMEVRPTWK